MRWSLLKRGLHWLCFSVFLILGIGQMPTVIGYQFLMLALLTVPIRVVHDFVDEMISLSAARWFYIFVIFRFLILLPAEEFSRAGKCMGRFLYTLCRILRI